MSRRSACIGSNAWNCKTDFVVLRRHVAQPASFMRPFLVLALFLGTLAGARAADPAITRVWAEWRSAESFDRISEYFGHGENTGGRHIVRTHADTRAGFYFLVDLVRAPALTDAKFEVQ